LSPKLDGTKVPSEHTTRTDFYIEFCQREDFFFSLKHFYLFVHKRARRSVCLHSAPRGEGGRARRKRARADPEELAKASQRTYHAIFFPFESQWLL
jgi:hypothetical protein